MSRRACSVLLVTCALFILAGFSFLGLLILPSTITSWSGNGRRFFSKQGRRRRRDPDPDRPLPLYVVFHVGPAKMGSTSLQIEGLQKHRAQLERDGYNTYDFRLLSKLNRCLAISVTVTQCEFKSRNSEWRQFVDFMNESQRQQRHVVLSTENYWNHLGADDTSTSSSLPKVYHDLFSTLHYQVRIVIAYRPLTDFWISAYYQNYAHYCGYEHSQASDKSKQKRIIPSVLDYIRLMNDTKQLKHPTFEARKHFTLYFDDVVILPLGPKLVERFLCTVMKNASHGCAAAVARNDDGDKKETILNAKHSLEWDRLAQTVRLHGLSTKPCKTLSKYLQQQLTCTRSNLLEGNTSSIPPSGCLPRTCLNKAQQVWFDNQTIAYQDALLLPSSLCSVKKRGAQSSRLCQVNVDKVLEKYSRLFAPRKNATP